MKANTPVTILSLLALSLIVANAQLEVDGLNPGIKFRIHERFLDLLRNEFKNEIPDLINYELKHENLPKYMENEYFVMKNIVYSPMVIDVDNFDVEFLTPKKGYKFLTPGNRAFVKMPLVRSWKIDFDFDMKGNWGFSDSASIEIDSLFFEAMFQVEIDHFGLPLWKIDEISFGAKYIDTIFPTAPYWDTLIDNYVNILNAVTSNAMNMFGMNFVNKVINNFSNLVLGSMEFPFVANIIEKYCTYMIDLRMTHKAEIKSEHMDMFFWG